MAHRIEHNMLSLGLGPLALASSSNKLCQPLSCFVEVVFCLSSSGLVLGSCQDPVLSATQTLLLVLAAVSTNEAADLLSTKVLERTNGPTHKKKQTTRSKKLLGAKGIPTRSKDATSSSWPFY